MPYSYTHITSSPLYTSTHHTIERLSRSSWQITSPLLPSPIPAKSYAEAKALAAEIDFSALSVKAAEPEPVVTNNPANYIKRESFVTTNDAIYTDRDAPGQADRMTFSNLEADEDGYVTAQLDPTPEVNPFEAILNEASQITDLGTMQGAYDQAVRECDFCAVFGHLGFRAPTNDARDAVEKARAKVPDDARVTELAGLLTIGEALGQINDDMASMFVEGADRLPRLVLDLCDLPDGYLKTALIRWACVAATEGSTWVARLRLEGAALRYAREVAFMAECERADREWKEPQKAQEVRMVEDGGRADMGRDSADLWGCVWSWACDEDLSEYLRADRVGELLPSLLSPEPEHWLPISADGRVLIINWRAGETTGEVISAAVWLDDGGLSLLGSYVLGSGWVSDDRLGEEDVDSEALGVILEAINARGLAVIA